MESNVFPYLNALENLEIKTDNYKHILEQTIKDVKIGNLEILNLLTKLECLLTDKSYSKREIGVLLLNAAIEASGNRLDYEQIKFLSIFYAAKLKEHHQVAVAALHGVFALVKNPIITSDDSVINSLISPIFSNIVCQQQQREERYLIYQILEFVFDHYLEVVNNVDNIYGIISSIDGERDPQNLIYLFKWLSRFLPNAKLDHLTECMFDILSCYFPIDFTNPAKENKYITRDKLAQNLCACLTAVADFGQFVIPLALEKLDSDVEIAKMDSLDVLIDGCAHYSPEIYHKHFPEIWNQLQKEIFTVKNEQIETKCLRTIEQIIQKLAMLNDKGKFKEAVYMTMLPVKDNLLSDSQFLNKQTTKILLAAAEASQLSSQFVMELVGPFLIKLLKEKNNDEDKASVVNDYLLFLQTLLVNNTDITRDDHIVQISIDLFDGAAFNDNNKNSGDLLAIEGYKGLTVLCQFLQENLREKIIGKLKHSILNENQREFKSVLMNCLKQMALKYPMEIENQFLIPAEFTDNDDIMKFDWFIDSIGHLSDLVYFEDLVANLVISYAIKDIQYSIVIFKHLPTFWNGNLSQILYKKNFIQKIIAFLSNLNDSQCDLMYLTNVRLILQVLIRQSRYDEEFENKSVYSLITKHTKFHSRLVYLTVLSSSVVIMKQGEFKDFENIDYLLNCYFNATAIASADDFLRNVVVEVLANILNKIVDEIIIEKTLNKIHDLCCSNATSTNISNVILLTIWITKSLFTRNHCKSWFWADQLIHWLSKTVADPVILSSLKLLMEDNSIISIENYCQITVLYKQKCFTYITNQLLDDELIEKQENYYNLISYLMESAPKQAIICQFKKIFKMILTCLEKSTDTNAILIILHKLNDYIKTKEAIIEENFEDLLLRILNLCTFEHSMKVRMESISWLRSCVEFFPIYKLLPYQEQVIYQLGLCLDDKKRLVRNDAMSCRCLWYLLDAPV